MEISNLVFFYEVIISVGLIGLIWNIRKVLIANNQEWIAVKGELVGYDARTDRSSELTHDLENMKNEFYFGQYEYVDSTGQKRIHTSKFGQDRKSDMGLIKTIYYRKDRPGMSSDSSTDSSIYYYLGILFFGSMILVAVYYY